jgi:hypothetical protein
MISSGHTAELDQLGYTLIRSFASADLLAELRATVAQLYAIEGDERRLQENKERAKAKAAGRR